MTTYDPRRRPVSSGAAVPGNRLLVRIFSRPCEFPFELAGDPVTQDLGRILASVSDGEVSRMTALIQHKQANEHDRSVANGWHDLAVTSFSPSFSSGPLASDRKPCVRKPLKEAPALFSGLRSGHRRHHLPPRRRLVSRSTRHWKKVIWLRPSATPSSRSGTAFYRETCALLEKPQDQHKRRPDRAAVAGIPSRPLETLVSRSDVMPMPYPVLRHP